MDPELSRMLRKLAKDFVNQTAEHLFSDKPPPRKPRPKRKKKGVK